MFRVGASDMVENSLYEVQNWLSDSDLNYEESSEYWNDEDEEKSKEWYILDGNFEKMENYIKGVGLIDQLNSCVDFLDKELNLSISGYGADLASGNLWAVPHILKNSLVEKLYCVEFSKQRLLKIGPEVLEYYNVQKDKIVLCLGSFNDLKLHANSLDFIFLSQAFHHSYRPNDTLNEIWRVLKPNGFVVMIGEHPISKIQVFKGYIANPLKFCVSKLVPENIQQYIFGKTFHNIVLFPSVNTLFPPDKILGDHYYTDNQYLAMFKGAGFKSYQISIKKHGTIGYILIKDD